MICKVKKTVEKYKMPLRGNTVYVALSGGADSMALLNCLNELRAEYKFELAACHVNHGIRGASADRDEEFAKRQCEKLNVPLKILHADVPTIANERGLGLEECGRQVRYEFFASLGDVLIATAHTLSDRCETLILNETRGASLKGVCSIPAVRGNIIRPLFDCTRADIEKYCEINNIPFVTDETNHDDTYSRNRIRLNVIPELKKINPSFEAAAKRLMDSAKDDEDYFEAETARIIKRIRKDKTYDANALLKLHSALRRRVIASLLRSEAGITPELIHIEMVDGILTGGKTQIIGNTTVVVEHGALSVDPAYDEFVEWQTDFSELNAVTPTGKFSGKIINTYELSAQQFVHNNVLDFDKIIGNCVLRNRRPGDKMRCAGSGCTKSLKKLFNEKKIGNRNSTPILADESGILWVYGIGCADRCKITKETKNILLMVEENK